MQKVCEKCWKNYCSCKMKVMAFTTYDLEQIVNLLSDAGYISHKTVSRFDCIIPPQYVEVLEKDRQEVLNLLSRYLGSQKYAYRGYYCD